MLIALVFLCAVGSGATAPAANSSAATATSVHQASNHPMRYHLALPVGWQADRSWPTLVVIPDAARDFEANLARFVRARGNVRTS